jgi:hypothetical protein
MVDDPISDRRRTREDEYFHKRDRELVEKMRRAAAADQARRDLTEKSGLTDPELVADLQALGFTPGTLPLLPLVPIVEMAWAEGGVTPAERSLIVELARARGITPGSDADGQLARWLDHRPDATVFARATRLIGAMLDAGGQTGLSASDLIRYCEQIAAASGGIFGIGKVSVDERETLARIAAALKSRA